MKPCFFLILILILLHHQSYSQYQINSVQPQTRESLLEKRNDQQIGGWVLLGGGLIGIAAVAPGNASFGTTGTVALVSGVAILGSIPLFLAAHRNKKKAMRMKQVSGDGIPDRFKMVNH